MGRLYRDDVRDYVIIERYKGKPWSQIQAEVAAEFNIRPPVIRQMQRWFQHYRQATKADPAGTKMIAEVVREATERAKPIAFSEVMQGLPTLWRFNELGVDLQDAGWMFILSVMEQWIGRDKFDSLVTRYQQLREEVQDRREK